MIERFFVDGKTFYSVVFQEYPQVEKPWAVMRTVFGHAGNGDAGKISQRLEHVDFATPEEAARWIHVAKAWNAIPEAKE